MGFQVFSPAYDVLGADADGLFIRDATVVGKMVWYTLMQRLQVQVTLVRYKEWLMKAVLILSIRTIMSNKLPSQVKSSYMLGNGIINHQLDQYQVLITSKVMQQFFWVPVAQGRLMVFRAEVSFLLTMNYYGRITITTTGGSSSETA